MFQNLESHATSIHESTSQIVDSLINFILRSYYALGKKAAEGINALIDRDSPKQQLNEPKPVSVELQINGQKVYAKQGEQETDNKLTQ